MMVLDGDVGIALLAASIAIANDEDDIGRKLIEISAILRLSINRKEMEHLNRPLIIPWTSDRPMIEVKCSTGLRVADRSSVSLSGESYTRVDTCRDKFEWIADVVRGLRQFAVEKDFCHIIVLLDEVAHATSEICSTTLVRQYPIVELIDNLPLGNLPISNGVNS
jgi:hypothetical protein